jgi:putative ABC transport system permease protein
MLWFHLDYLEEGLKQSGATQAGNAGIIYIKAESAEVIPDLAQRIDARFANSSIPTRSESEEAFIQMFIEMSGNVQAFVRNISLAVVFSLVLVAANAMAMAVRERTSEVAVLKAIGFTRPLVLGLILGESVMIPALGGLLGVLGGQALCFAAHTMFPLYWGVSALPWRVVGYGIVLAGLIGLVSGIVPAWRASQLSVIDGLRKVV